MSFKRTVLVSAILWLALLTALHCALYLLVRQSKKFTVVRWGYANR